MAADCFYAGDIAGKFGNLFGPSVIGRQVVDSTENTLRDLIGKSIVLHKASGAKGMRYHSCRARTGTVMFSRAGGSQ